MDYNNKHHDNGRNDNTAYSLIYHEKFLVVSLWLLGWLAIIVLVLSRIRKCRVVFRYFLRHIEVLLKVLQNVYKCNATNKNIDSSSNDDDTYRNA